VTFILCLAKCIYNMSKNLRILECKRLFCMNSNFFIAYPDEPIVLLQSLNYQNLFMWEKLHIYTIAYKEYFKVKQLYK